MVCIKQKCYLICVNKIYILYDAGNAVNRKNLKISRAEGGEKMGPCVHICSKVDAPYTGNKHVELGKPPPL